MEQREVVPILPGAVTAGPRSLKGGGQHQRSPLQSIAAEFFHLPCSIICLQKNTQGPTEQQNVESSPATIQCLWNCFMIAIEGFLFNRLIKSELTLLCSLEKLLKHFRAL